jgi:hypothetical protein
MVKIILALVTLTSFSAHAWDAPEVFKNTCYEGFPI